MNTFFSFHKIKKKYFMHVKIPCNITLGIFGAQVHYAHYIHCVFTCIYSPPQWRRGSGLDCGSDDPSLIPGLPSPRVGPLMARR